MLKVATKYQHAHTVVTFIEEEPAWSSQDCFFTLWPFFLHHPLPFLWEYFIDDKNPPRLSGLFLTSL